VAKHCKDTVISCIGKLFDLLTVLGMGYMELTQYKLKRSLKDFQNLSSEQFNTGKVLSWVKYIYL